MRTVRLFYGIKSAGYTAADLAYYSDCRANREQNDPTARPAIAGELPDMSRYDTVVIGHPIWHGQAPKICGNSRSEQVNICAAIDKE